MGDRHYLEFFRRDYPQIGKLNMSDCKSRPLD